MNIHVYSSYFDKKRVGRRVLGGNLGAGGHGRVCTVAKCQSSPTRPKGSNKKPNNKTILRREGMNNAKIPPAHFWTWKLHMDDATCDTTMIQQQDPFQKWKIVQPLSLDPSGKEPLSETKTLQEQGLKHGSMIYCRVEQRENPAVSDEETNDDSQKKKKPNDDVIELLSSSDDDDDDEVQIVPNKATRKRPLSTTSQTTSSKQAKATSTISSPSVSSNVRNFRIVSYNIWFGPPDPTVNQLYPRQRMEAIAQILKQCNHKDDDNDGQSTPLLFVGFQEMTSTLRRYLQPQLETMGYQLATQPLQHEASYGVGLAVSSQLKVIESKFVPFPNSPHQGRGLLYVRTAQHLFATTHLESFIDNTNNGAKERQRQIQLAAEFCQEQLDIHPGLELAMVAGDFNWDDERKRGKGPNAPLMELLDAEWKDAGKPFDYTYDGQANCMLGNKLRRRLDRCIYLRNKNNNNSKGIKATLQTVGRDPIEPALIWNKRNPYNGSVKQLRVAPSDHFGIEVHFQK
eukprot:scaffold2553_cov138-Cylindrotheca_fusiformis.AAC.11